MTAESKNAHDTAMPPPPRGLALLAILGPGLMWCGEYIGSGEVILATRNGAIFGTAVLWIPVIAILGKYFIGLAGAHYTVTTGEGMIDMLSRTPGPKNWVLWPVFIGQISAGAISTAALANAAGIFAAYFVPLEPHVLGWAAAFLVIALTWSGAFAPIKRVMTVLVTAIVIGTGAVAVKTWPGFGAVAEGLFGFAIPDTPTWAQGGSGNPSPWFEVLPLIGWAAGGFASQVWYTYWILGAGYGMAHGRGYGRPLDPARLAALTEDDARQIRHWRRLVTVDATMALTIGIGVSAAFLIAGAGILGPLQIAPDGPDAAFELSRIFGEKWGEWGAHLFVLAGLCAMLSTMLGQFAGWPRLLADCARILVPGVAKYSWKAQFRTILLAYAASNMIIVYTLGAKPVWLVQTSAILDGLLLTPLQAIAVGLVFYTVMPKLLPEPVRAALKPSLLFLPGLVLAFAVFMYFCVMGFVDFVR